MRRWRYPRERLREPCLFYVDALCLQVKTKEPEQLPGYGSVSRADHDQQAVSLCPGDNEQIASFCAVNHGFGFSGIVKIVLRGADDRASTLALPLDPVPRLPMTTCHQGIFTVRPPPYFLSISANCSGVRVLLGEANLCSWMALNCFASSGVAI